MTQTKTLIMKNTFFFIGLLCFSFLINKDCLANQNPNQNQELLQQLCSLNKYWGEIEATDQTIGSELSDLLANQDPIQNHEDLIQLHLQLVEKTLRSKNVDHLTAVQKQNRVDGLAILNNYWNAGLFPQNNHHSITIPYFIDDNNTACAVGHILRESGEIDFAHKISRENNYAFIEDMNYPELGIWADEMGFTVEELKWIQPAYSPEVYYMPEIFEPECGSSNGAIIGTLFFGQFGQAGEIVASDLTWSRLDAEFSATGVSIENIEAGFYRVQGTASVQFEDGTMVDFPIDYSRELASVDAFPYEAELTNTSCGGGVNDGALTMILPEDQEYDVKIYRGIDLISEGAYAEGLGFGYHTVLTRGLSDGCLSVGYFSISATSWPPSLSASVGSSSNCLTADVSINYFDNDTPDGTVLWNDGFVGLERFNVPFGDYTISSTDDFGCSSSYDFTVGDPDCTTECDLTWLNELITTLPEGTGADGQPCYCKIDEFLLDNQYVYYLYSNCNEIDPPDVLYDCEGVQICLTNGEIQDEDQCSNAVLEGLDYVQTYWDECNAGGDCESLEFVEVYGDCGECCENLFVFDVAGGDGNYTLTTQFGQVIYEGNENHIVLNANEIDEQSFEMTVYLTDGQECEVETLIQFAFLCCDVAPPCFPYGMEYDCDSGLQLLADGDCSEFTTIISADGNIYEVGNLLDEGTYSFVVEMEYPPCTYYDYDVIVDCEVDDCNVDDPLSMPWLAALVANSDGCFPNSIQQIELNGEVYFLANSAYSISGLLCPSDLGNLYYSCSGEVVCTIGSIGPEPICPDGLIQASQDAPVIYEYDNCQGDLPEYDITTQPYCVGQGLFNVGVSVTGGSGYYTIGENYLGITVYANSWQEEIITLASGSEFYDIYPIDANTGCSNDYIIAVEDPGCDDFENTCNLTDPASLGWIQELANDPFWCDCGYTIRYGCVNGMGVFVADPTGGFCDDVFTIYYDIFGNEICTEGGFAGTECPELSNDYYNIQDVWTCGGACSFEPDPGPCEAAIPAWYYDPSIGTCLEFTYGGCEGNSNNYETFELCLAACGGSIEPCTDVAGVDFGFCDGLMGVAIVNGQCTYVSGCFDYVIDGVDYTDAFFDSMFLCSDACGAVPVEPCTDVAGVDFGDCDFPLGVTLINGECVGISGCDFIANGLDYSNAFYESFEFCAELCGNTPVEPCTDLTGIDFGLCAAVLGVALADGQCTTISGCGYVIDGIDYSNAFSDSYEICVESCIGEAEPCSYLDYVYFGPCDLELGYGNVNGQCVSISGCDYIAYGIDWSPAVYGTMELCMESCGFLPCDFACPAVYDPVCGVDGLTYSNSCYADCAGVEVAYQGECDDECPGEFATGTIVFLDESFIDVCNGLYIQLIEPNGQLLVFETMNVDLNSIANEGDLINFYYYEVLTDFPVCSLAAEIFCYEIIDGNDPEVFNDYPWLNDLVNPNNCDGISISVYDLGPYAYIYINDNGAGSLYFENGSFYCSDSPGFSCVTAYGLGNPTSTWNCGGIDPCACDDVYNPVCGVDGNTYSNECEAACANVAIAYYGPCDIQPNPPVFDTYPWLAGIVDPNNCEGTTISVYDLGPYAYVFIEDSNGGALYFQDGTFYCSDSPGFSCVSAYNLGAPTSVWTCGEGGNDCDDPLSLDWVQSAINDGCTVALYSFEWNGEPVIYRVTSEECMAFDDTNYLATCDGAFICGNGFLPLEFICPTEVQNFIVPENQIWSTGGGSDPQVFIDYPWLTDIVNPNNCDGEVITVYDLGFYAYVHVETSDGGALYFEGTYYCGDSQGFSCVQAYGLSSGDISATWTCGDGGGGPNPPDFGDFPWLADFVDTENCCNNIAVTAYYSGIYTYIYIATDLSCSNEQGSLYFEDGSQYCTDAPGFSCVDAYGLNDMNSMQIWACGDDRIDTGGDLVEDLTFNVYPNPSNGRFNIDLEGISENQQNIHIYDIQGRLIENIVVEANSTATTIPIDLSSVNNGVYFVKLMADYKTKMEKILIQK